MSLPEESVAANTLPEVTTIPTGKKLIFTDPDTNEGGIITLENLTKQILQNLTSQTFTLDQGNLTLLQALNQLNSKTTINKWNFYSGLSTTNDEVKALSSKGHLAGILIVDQNGRSNIYATGKTSKVTPISITYNDIESPTIVNDTFKIPLKAWSAYLFISDDPEVKTL